MTDEATKRARLRAVRQRLGDEVSPEAGALALYIEFTDALTAAGLSRALGEDFTADLRHAGRAGLAVFRTRGNQEMVVTDLDTGEITRKPDTSAANPTTMVQALLAALASEDSETAAQLARVSAADAESDQAPAPPVIAAASAALRNAVAGDRPGVRSCVARALADDSIYGEILRQLDRWSRGAAVDADVLRHADRASWQHAGFSADDPIVELCLPELGLSALERLQP